MTATATAISDRPMRLHMGPPRRRRQVLALVKLSDTLAMVTAFVAATVLTGWINNGSSLDVFVSTRLKISNFIVFVALVASWRVAFSSLGLYRDQRSPLARRRFLNCTKAIALGTLVLSALGIMLRMQLITPFFLLAFSCMAMLLVIGGRVAMRSALHFLGKTGSLNRIVLIAGTSPRALRIADQMERNSSSGVRIAGFVDEQWPGSASFRLSGRHLVSDLKNFGAFLRHHVVDEIVIALPASVLSRHRKKLFETCRVHGITVRFPASLLIDEVGGPGRRPWDEIVMTIYNGSVEGWDLVAKRFIDAALASTLLLAAAPLMTVIAVLIKSTSPGPVLFSQDRMGRNKRTFRMHKFRTMYLGSEERLREFEHLNEMVGPTFKLTGDPRITPLGRFLRRSSLDELPQLIHVLKGEMSLVGPRPLALRDVNLFENDRHRRRFSVRPGMTGLWQVSGRSLIPFEDWMELDLRYIDEWSLMLDARILLKTIPVVLSGKGAL